MENKNVSTEEKEIIRLEREAGLEETRLEHLEDELQTEKKELNHLQDEIQELKNEHNHPDHKTIKLIFIVNGTPAEINALENAPLETAVAEALKKTGNNNRPISEWTVKQGSDTLDIKKKVKEFHFHECEELFVSLNAGQGGCDALKAEKCR